MRRFELVEGSSSKFWEVSVDGSSLTTRWGKIGTSGQSKTKAFASAAAAQKEHDALVTEKTGKGYSEVTAGGATPAAPGARQPPPPDEVKDLVALAKAASTKGEPMTRIYIMVRGKTKAAADDINRAGGPTIGLDATSRPRYKDARAGADNPGTFMHHLWTIDLDQVPELRRYERLAKARAVALMIHKAENNECFEPGIGRHCTRIVPISQTDLTKGEWSGPDIPNQPAGASLALYPVEVPSRIFDETIDFFELEESEDEREVKLSELYSKILSADRLGGSPIYFQGDDHRGEYLGQFSESIVDVNLGDAGTMYVFCDLAFWACH
jgi:predicted DNA-binding WGR domain protein